MAADNYKDPEDFGYSAEEIRNLTPAEWQATQEVIKTHPDTIKAEEKIGRIIKLAQQWTDGLVLATEATSEMKRILKE